MSQCDQQWKQFGRLRRRVTVAFWGGLAAEIVLRGTVEFVTPRHSYENVKEIGPLLVFIVPWMIFMRQFTSWPCPRCGKPFVGRQKLGDMWRRMHIWPDQCENCGLPESADAPIHESPVKT